eukprot:767765-Hanusia_phi.AAC.1
MKLGRTIRLKHTDEKEEKKGGQDKKCREFEQKCGMIREGWQRSGSDIKWVGYILRGGGRRFSMGYSEQVGVVKLGAGCAMAREWFHRR